MILRALFISLVLHLVILVSPRPVSSAAGGQAGGVRPLRAVFGGAGVPQDKIPLVAGTGRQDKKRVGGERLAGSVPSRPVTPAGIAHFLPSTVALSPPGQMVDRKVEGGEAPDASLPTGEGVREYRLNLAREARRFKRYPSVANGRDVEGVVVVSVSALAGSRWPETRLQHSSGDETLDRLALEMMASAVRTAIIPAELQGREFRITVPVEYRLTD